MNHNNASTDFSISAPMILCDNHARGSIIMIHEIIPIAEHHIAGFHGVLNAVARERRFLAFLEAPPLEQMQQFVLNNIDEGYPQFVVFIDGQIVGWCDVIPNSRRAMQAHCGALGVGLLPQFRGQGIGRELVQRTIDAALEFGLTRIELMVRETNVNAIALYKKFGFEAEGLHRKAVRIGGRYENLLSMALVTE
jgi:RimJ/RimL family protein N-acetyltransferase